MSDYLGEASSVVFALANSRDLFSLFNLTKSTPVFENDALLACLGYSRDELKSMPAHKLWPAGEIEALKRHLDPLKTHGYAEAAATIYARDGKKRLLKLRASLLKEQVDDFALIHVVDVTEKSRREGLAFQESKLAVLGEITAVLTHEISSSVQAINAYFYLLKNDKASVLSGPTMLRLNAASTALQSMENLIRNVQKYAVHGEPRRDYISLPDVVGGVLQILGGYLKSHKVELQLDFEADLPQVWADGNHCQQIILVLVKNAAQAMANLPKRQIRIHVAKVSDQVDLSITDTGMGVDIGQIDDIFQPFRTTKSEGLGMGLAIAKKLADANDAKLRVESVHGVGAKFHLLLPTKDPRPQLDHDSAEMQLSLTGKSILIFSEQDSLIRTIEKVVANKGGRTKIAARASDALQVIATGSIALIFCDDRSYPISGAVFASELRRGLIGSPIGFLGPIVLIADSSSASANETIRSGGISEILNPDVSADEISNLLTCRLLKP